MSCWNPNFHDMAADSSLVGPHRHIRELMEFLPWPVREGSRCSHFTEERLEVLHSGAPHPGHGTRMCP